MEKNIIDCKGLSCPTPVINTKKYLDGIKSGSCITIVDNVVAKNNIIKLATNSGFKYEVEEKENIFNITIVKSDDIKDENGENNKEEYRNMPFTIVIASDKLGEGSNELGTALMKSYLFALSEADIIPDNLLFINSGVKLVVEDAPTLESISKLIERGTSVQSCGLCLDFYELKSKLKLGEITNMYAIIEIMNSSRTIKI